MSNDSHNNAIDKYFNAISIDSLREDLAYTLNHKINVEEIKMKMIQDKIENEKHGISIGDFLCAMQCVNDIKSAVSRLNTAVEDMFA